MTRILFLSILIFTVSGKLLSQSHCILQNDTVFYEVINDYEAAIVCGSDVSIWYGSAVALVIDGDQEPEKRHFPTMEKIVRTFDRIIEKYGEITGRIPPNYAPLRGRIRLEFNMPRDGYGAGGASHESLGIHATRSFFEGLYDRVRAGDLSYDQVYFYELNRCFWFSDMNPSIDYFTSTGDYGYWTVGFNNAMAIIVPAEVLGVDDLYYFGQNLEQFSNSMFFNLKTYIDNPTTYTYENSWLSSLLPWSQTPVSLNDLMTATIVYLYNHYGRLEFISKLFRQIPQRIPLSSMADLQRARDNFYVSASLAASENLIPFFMDTLRWEISDSAIGAVEESLLNPEILESPLSSFSYEPFSIENNDLQRNGSGSGWFANWQMQNPNGIMEIREGSLVYESLHTEGNHLYFAPETDEPRVEITRYMDKNIGCEGSSIWLSFLFKAEKVANGGVEVVPGTSLFNTFGKIWGGNLGIYTSPSQAIQEGETYFIVSKINVASGADSMFLWVNPGLNSEPMEAEAGVVYTGYDIGTINRLQLLVQGWGQGEYHIDEIRIADNWNSVAPTKKLPVILKSPTSQTVCENDNLSLSVTAEGQNISYQWYKDDNVIDGETDSLLFVPDALDGIEGSYYCYVYNDDGIGIESSKAHISLQPKPSIDFNLPDTISINDAPLDLIGNAPDAFFSVSGSIIESFDPAIFGIGTHQLDYSFNDGDCLFTTSTSISVIDSVITGIRAFDEIISVYPNPASSEIKIVLPANLTVDKLSISDSQGKRIYLRSEEISAGLNNVLLSDTLFGLYILQICTSKGSFSKKIFIQ